MPLPIPAADETRDVYIARCMKIQSREFDLSDENQRRRALAICFSKWRNIKKECAGSKFKTLRNIIEEI